MAKKQKKAKAERDEKGRVLLSKNKQSKVDAKKMTLEERVLRIEIILGIVEAE